MAVGVVIELERCSAEQYDQILDLMGLTHGRAPKHAIFHVAGPTPDGGWRVVDVWDSAEAFNRFAEEKIIPFSLQVGITEEPKVQVWPVHNTMTPQGQVHLALQIT